MVTIRYSLTSADLAELEAERRGGLVVRILRIPASALIGGIGLVLAWQAVFFFPWTHWFGNLALAGMGLLFLWIGTDLPGRKWLSQRFSDPFSESEVQIDEGKLVCSHGEKKQQFRWFPKRGFRENENFFFLQAFDAKLAIPKRVVTPEQERSLRALAQPQAEPQKQDRNEAIECSFCLTEDELNEASAARQNWFIHRWFHTKYGRVVGRVLCGLGALGLLWLPARLGSSWAEEFRKEPGVATILIGFDLLWLWTAAGCPGSKTLNQLGLERRIRIDADGVEVTRGAQTSTYPWKRFFSYQETPNLFIVRPRILLQFWTIPKRALQPGDEEKLRSLLDRKLPQQ